MPKLLILTFFIQSNDKPIPLYEILILEENIVSILFQILLLNEVQFNLTLTSLVLMIISSECLSSISLGESNDFESTNELDR